MEKKKKRRNKKMNKIIIAGFTTFEIYPIEQFFFFDIKKKTNKQTNACRNEDMNIFKRENERSFSHEEGRQVEDSCRR